MAEQKVGHHAEARPLGWSAFLEPQTCGPNPPLSDRQALGRPRADPGGRQPEPGAVSCGGCTAGRRLGWWLSGGLLRTANVRSQPAIVRQAGSRSALSPSGRSTARAWCGVGWRVRSRGQGGLVAVRRSSSNRKRAVPTRHWPTGRLSVGPESIRAADSPSRVRCWVAGAQQGAGRVGGCPVVFSEPQTCGLNPPLVDRQVLGRPRVHPGGRQPELGAVLGGGCAAGRRAGWWLSGGFLRTANVRSQPDIGRQGAPSLHPSSTGRPPARARCGVGR